jgi:hypothetical protein
VLYYFRFNCGVGYTYSVARPCMGKLHANHELYNLTGSTPALVRVHLIRTCWYVRKAYYLQHVSYVDLSRRYTYTTKKKQIPYIALPYHVLHTGLHTRTLGFPVVAVRHNKICIERYMHSEYVRYLSYAKTYDSGWNTNYKIWGRMNCRRETTPSIKTFHKVFMYRFTLKLLKPRRLNFL